MAKNHNILVKIQGNVDGLTFYEKGGQQYVRRTPRSNRAKFATDPGMARVRENVSEFKLVSSSAKKLWDTFRPITANTKDGNAYLRLRTIMNELKKLDTTSLRGQRNPIISLTDTTGKDAVKGFDFNTKAQLDSLIFKPYQLNTTTGKLIIEAFNPMVHLASVLSATHFSIMLSKVDIDLTSSKAELVQSNEVQLAITSTASDIVLQLGSDTSINGLQLFILQIYLFQEMNGQVYPLKDKTHNASKIIEVL